MIVTLEAIWRRTTFVILAGVLFCYNCGCSHRGGLKVYLTLRLNVLAVCVAIAFVGAILVMF